MTDREKLIALLRVPIYPREGVDPAVAVADYLLDMGVVVREKGEWVRYADDKFSGYDANGRLKYRKVYTYECPRCGENTAAKRNFCPNCGADMRKGESDG